MSNPIYEHEFIEELFSDGCIKHIYDPPLHPKHAPVYEIIEDFLDTQEPPQILVLHDLLSEQSITIACQPTDDLPSILRSVLTSEKSLLHFLHLMPDSHAIRAGVKLHRGRLSHEYNYTVNGTQIIIKK